MNPPSISVRRIMRASSERVFAAWTDARQLQAWWGPPGVTCPEAEVDLRIGGVYRIANRLPDGTVAWITGRFQRIDPPHELVFSWRFEGGPEGESQVTVRFEPHPEGTEVVVLHEGVLSDAVRAEHERGWEGCLDGLVAYVA